MEEKNDEEKDRTRPSTLLMDLGKVILYSKEDLAGKMNPRHKQLVEEQGEDYPFFDYFGVNEELLDLLEELKDDFKIFMITEGHIQEHPPLHERLSRVFDDENIFSTGDLRLDKKKKETYEYAVEQLGVSPGEILFVDDSAENVSAASNAKLQTIQCTSEEQMMFDIKKVLGIEE